MMEDFAEDGEEFRFFDALEEDVAPVTDSESNGLESSHPRSAFDEFFSSSLSYDVWIRSPESIQERRGRFLDMMGLSLDRSHRTAADDMRVGNDVMEEEADTVAETSGESVNTRVSKEDECSSRQPSMLSRSDSGPKSLEGAGLLQGTFKSRMRNLNVELPHNAKLSNCPEEDSRRSSTSEDVEGASSGSSSSGHHRFMPQDMGVASNVRRKIEGIKKGWSSGLRFLRCTEDGQVETGNLRRGNPNQGVWAQRVKVFQSGKRLKELSALYKWQDIPAHKGSILTMKFSPDGRYLASASEDGIVRCWQVFEDERLTKHDIPVTDPSCLYFMANHLPQFSPLAVDNEKMGHEGRFRKSSDLSCFILPPNVFRKLESPLHEFHGHSGEILDLSWSEKNLLLSASADKTVRLWKMGCDHCLKVFLHNDYVTSVQFNPVDDSYFISGSIDGKIRIWTVQGCQVINWTDAREIITSVCYRPNGKGAVVGSITGNCRFYNLSDNYLQLDTQICLRRKKKSPGKRITGLQFLPNNPAQVMVTCADSEVRILQGNSVVSKCRGLRKAGSRIAASLTSDGKKTVSACEDSNLRVWNNTSPEDTVLPQWKSIRSCAHLSINAPDAMPWRGLKILGSDNDPKLHVLDSFSSRLSLSNEFIEPFSPKGSATWPEEKLQKLNRPSTLSMMQKPQYKVLKDSFQRKSMPNAWGLVIP